MHTRADHQGLRDREQFREEIILVARRIFLDRGVSQTSMTHLAQALGVSKPTVYEMFSSKQLLLDAVFKSAVDDVDYGWILRAAESLPPLHVFLDQTAEGYKQLLSTPRRLEAFRLLIREGGHSAELTEAFGRYLSGPASIAARKLVAHAISVGDCIPMDVEVVQKLVTAPLIHLVVDTTLNGERGIKPELVETYIDAAMAALTLLLSTNATARTSGSPPQFRAPG